jgi:hypothetical protein
MESGKQQSDADDKRDIRIAVTGMLVFVCTLAYCLCIYAELKVLGWGSLRDDGLAGQLRVERIGLYLVVTVLSCLMLLLTAAAWKWTKRQVWYALMAVGVAVLLTAQCLPSTRGVGNADFLRGFGERVKNQIDLKNLKELAAQGQEKQFEDKAIVEPLEKLLVSPKAPVYIWKHDSKEKTIIVVWSRVLGMVVGPEDMPPEPAWPGGPVIQVEAGVYMTNGIGG